MEQARRRGRERKPAKSSGPRPQKDPLVLSLSIPNVFISVLFSALLCQAAASCLFALCLSRSLGSRSLCPRCPLPFTLPP